MKRKHTTARRARTTNAWSAYQKNTLPVFLRRALLNQYGADSKEFDARHPEVEEAAAGLRSRIAQAKKERVGVIPV